MYVAFGGMLGRALLCVNELRRGYVCTSSSKSFAHVSHPLVRPQHVHSQIEDVILKDHPKAVVMRETMRRMSTASKMTSL